MGEIVKLHPDLFDSPAEAELRDELAKTTRSLDKLRKAYWARTNELEARVALLEETSSLVVRNLCTRAKE